jgi:hypothetical protein
MELFDEKTGDRKTRDRVPLTILLTPSAIVARRKFGTVYLKATVINILSLYSVSHGLKYFISIFLLLISLIFSKLKIFQIGDLNTGPFRIKKKFKVANGFKVIST